MLSQQALNVLKKSIGTTSSLPMYKSKKKPVSRSLAKKAIESMKARSSSAQQPCLTRGRNDKIQLTKQTLDGEDTMNSSQMKQNNIYMEKIDHTVGQADIRMSNAHQKINGILKKQVNYEKELPKRQTDKPLARPKHIISSKPNRVKKTTENLYLKQSKPVNSRAEMNLVNRAASGTRKSRDLTKSFTSDISQMSLKKKRGTSTKNVKSPKHLMSSETRNCSTNSKKKHRISSRINSFDNIQDNSHQDSMRIQHNNVMNMTPSSNIVNVRIPSMHGQETNNHTNTRLSIE